MLFSATQTRNVEDLGRVSLRKAPLYVGVDDHKETATVDGLEQVRGRAIEMATKRDSTVCHPLLSSSPLPPPSNPLSLPSLSFLPPPSLSPHSAEMFVFVEETDSDRRNELRKYGYSLRGKPATNHPYL